MLPKSRIQVMLLGPTRKPKKTNDIMAEKQVLAEIQMKYKLVVNHSRKLQDTIQLMCACHSKDPTTTKYICIVNQVTD